MYSIIYTQVLNRPSAEWYNEITREERQRVIKKMVVKCSFKKSKLTGRTLFVKTGVVLTYNER